MVDYRPMVDNIDPLAGLNTLPVPSSVKDLQCLFHQQTNDWTLSQENCRIHQDQVVFIDTECNQQICCSILLCKLLMVGVFIMSTDLEQITNKSIGYKYLTKRNISQASPAKGLAQALGNEIWTIQWQKYTGNCWRNCPSVFISLVFLLYRLQQTTYLVLISK